MTATTPRVSSPCGTSAAALPVPWLYTTGSRSPYRRFTNCFHSEKAHRAWFVSALAVSTSARSAKAPSTSPACRSLRASWIERAAPGSAVSVSP